MGSAATRGLPDQFERVQQWLDALDPIQAKRDPSTRPEHGAAWYIGVGDPEIQRVRLFLPPDFPASPCRLYVDPQHFLRIPHIEANGHVCLGQSARHEDYSDAVGAVTRALHDLRKGILTPLETPTWIEQEFHKERESYWTHMCHPRRWSRQPVAGRTLVDTGTVNRWTSGTLAAYVPAKSPHRRFREQVAVACDADANRLAARHGWSRGMLVRGNALFVRLPDDQRWTPTTWPTTFEQLDELIARATDRELSLTAWLDQAGFHDDPVAKPKKKRRWRGSARPPIPPAGQRPLLVTLLLGSSLFGYQVFAPTVPSLSAPTIEPLRVTRIDPDWALARDQELAALHARRAKRVLVLGCGSLGSPLITLLARAGVGHLDIVDSEKMSAENSARHELGIDDTDQEKAPTLAARLRKQIPCLSVEGFSASVTRWCPQHCHPGDYSLVIECTGESSVRTYLSQMRSRLFGDCPLIHTWVEPLCSAGHIVFTLPALPWPSDDPADSHVNASDLSANDTRIQLPGCASGFHPYGAADVTQVAAFAAERILGALDSPPSTSQVWSWVRSQAFFSSLTVPVTTRDVVPPADLPFGTVTVTRELAAVLQSP